MVSSDSLLYIQGDDKEVSVMLLQYCNGRNLGNYLFPEKDKRRDHARLVIIQVETA